MLTSPGAPGVPGGDPAPAAPPDVGPRRTARAGTRTGAAAPIRDDRVAAASPRGSAARRRLARRAHRPARAARDRGRLHGSFRADGKRGDRHRDPLPRRGGTGALPRAARESPRLFDPPGEADLSRLLRHAAGEPDPPARRPEGEAHRVRGSGLHVGVLLSVPGPAEGRTRRGAGGPRDLLREGLVPRLAREGAPGRRHRGGGRRHRLRPGDSTQRGRGCGSRRVPDPRPHGGDPARGVAARFGLDPAISAKVREALLALDSRTDAGRRVLRPMATQLNGFAPCDESVFDAVRELVTEKDGAR